MPESVGEAQLVRPLPGLGGVGRGDRVGPVSSRPCGHGLRAVSRGACRRNQRKPPLPWRRPARRPSGMPAGVVGSLHVEDIVRKPAVQPRCESRVAAGGCFPQALRAVAPSKKNETARRRWCRPGDVHHSTRRRRRGARRDCREVGSALPSKAKPEARRLVINWGRMGDFPPTPLRVK